MQPRVVTPRLPHTTPSRAPSTRSALQSQPASETYGSIGHVCSPAPLDVRRSPRATPASSPSPYNVVFSGCSRNCWTSLPPSRRRFCCWIFTFLYVRSLEWTCSRCVIASIYRIGTRIGSIYCGACPDAPGLDFVEGGGLPRTEESSSMQTICMLASSRGLQ